MKIYPKQSKATPGWGYWGNYGEIDMGFSSGLIECNEDYPGEPVHYHKQAITYILVLEGAGLIEINAEVVKAERDSLLQIDAGESYCILGAAETPFRWIAISTNKEPGDRVVVKI